MKGVKRGLKKKGLSPMGCLSSGVLTVLRQKQADNQEDKQEETVQRHSDEKRH